jgi:hypothetical protein
LVVLGLAVLRKSGSWAEFFFPVVWWLELLFPGVQLWAWGMNFLTRNPISLGVMSEWVSTRGDREQQANVDWSGSGFGFG